MRFGVRGVVLVTLLLPFRPAAGLPRTSALRLAPRASSSAFHLAAAANVVLLGNRVRCNITNAGEHCVDPTNHPAFGGGFWPGETIDQYIFNSGLQVTAIIPGVDAPRFPWPGDTVGAFFFDPRGDQSHGAPVAGLYDSRAGTAGWPAAASVRDTALFASALIGRATASEQDTWVRFWDVSTNRTGRPHPMGILVEQRTLAWSYPVGNDDIVYQLFRLVNVTSRDPARYAGLSALGYSAADIADFAELGRVFQQRMRTDFDVDVPDSGFAWSRLYAAFQQDMDIGQSGSNINTANLPFALSTGYKLDFREPQWQYPADRFFSPFAEAPGFEAEVFLRVANQPGAINVWTGHSGGAPYPDRVGVSALWREHSGNLLPTEGTCSVPLPQVAVRHFCQAIQVGHDARGGMSTALPTLGPGQAVTIVAALAFAAPVESIGGWSIRPFITTNSFAWMTPGLPLDDTRLVAGLDSIRNVDRAMGWVSHTDADGDGAVEWNEVITVPRSLLWKAQLARTMLANRFQLPEAPAAPQFHVLPGDGRVTVVWRPSASEQTGDPYFAIAADPTSPLYDPNYREMDVEGYRVWRGTAPSTMQMVAQFDYAGTTFTDRTGQLLEYGNRCAPELGVTATCPTFPIVRELGGWPVQVRPGDRVLLANQAVSVVRSDTMVTGGGTGYPALQDTGVPLVFSDTTVTNGVTYYYAVTAFDANSWVSGPSSLASPLMPRVVTPRIPAGNRQPAIIVTGTFGDDTTALDVAAGVPNIDAATGTFSGILPPSNSGRFDFLVPPPPEVLPPGAYVARIDSVSQGIPASLGAEPRMFISFSAPGVSMPVSFTVPFSSHGNGPSVTEDFETTLPLVRFDTARARLLGLPADFSAGASLAVMFGATFVPIVQGPAATMLCTRPIIATTTCAGGSAASRIAMVQASRYLLHSRFWDAGQPEPPDATIDFNPSVNRNSGNLAGVTSIWAPLSYRQPLAAGGTTRIPAVFRYVAYALTAFHPADYLITWGAGGAVTVRDSTHRVDLPYNRGAGAGYGFISGAAIAAAGVTSAQILMTGELGTPNPAVPSYHSLYTVRGICDGSLVASGLTPPPCVDLSRTAVLQQLDQAPASPDGAGDGTGIVMMINGETFFLQMAALPAPGTRWRFRAIGGLGLTATCTPALPAGVTEQLAPPLDCFDYAYVTSTNVRPPLVPGLQFKILVTQGYGVLPTSGDLARVHTVPDPYYLSHAVEDATGRQLLRFVNLPDRGLIRIYSVSGILVAMISHNDAAGGGEAEWDLRSRTGRRVASGVYFWHLTTADGRQRVGRLTVVNGER